MKGRQAADTAWSIVAAAFPFLEMSPTRLVRCREQSPQHSCTLVSDVLPAQPGKKQGSLEGPHPEIGRTLPLPPGCRGENRRTDAIRMWSEKQTGRLLLESHQDDSLEDLTLEIAPNAAACPSRAKRWRQ
jgi:hypothetical protein